MSSWTEWTFEEVKKPGRTKGLKCRCTLDSEEVRAKSYNKQEREKKIKNKCLQNKYWVVLKIILMNIEDFIYSRIFFFAIVILKSDLVQQNEVMFGLKFVASCYFCENLTHFVPMAIF